MEDNDILLKLSKVVGERNILTDDEAKIIYGKDLTDIFHPSPKAIVFPASTCDVVEIVKIANEMLIPLVPSGGRTGYSGGAVAKNKEIVVSFEKMNKIVNFEPIEKTLTCEAGVVTKRIQNFAIKNDLFYPVEFASSGSSHIGGNIATNAGGVNVLRYGTTGNWISAIEVVTGNGDILNVDNSLIKNVCGYDLYHLFIGSEGTIGFITQATVKLKQKPLNRETILFSLSDHSSLLNILDEYQSIVKVSAFEFFSNSALRYVMLEFGLTHPFSESKEFYGLIDFDAEEHAKDSAIKLSEKLLQSGVINDALVSNSIKDIDKLWGYREKISLSLRKYTPYKFDIAVLPNKVPNFLNDLMSLFSGEYLNAEAVFFGHIGDGNIHLNLCNKYNMNPKNFRDSMEKTAKKVYLLVEKHKGTISAEHGVGLIKKAYMRHTRNENEIKYMHQIKNIFDKNNIMNRGKIF